MKKLIVVLAMVLLVVLIAWAIVAWAGEIEELNWQWRALVAELNVKQADANRALQEAQAFAATLDAKGYMVDQKSGQVVKKGMESKPAEPKPAPKAPAPASKK
jgi:hypothetical protein